MLRSEPGLTRPLRQRLLWLLVVGSAEHHLVLGIDWNTRQSVLYPRPALAVSGSHRTNAGGRARLVTGKWSDLHTRREGKQDSLGIEMAGR